jgi:hypothetical protein
LGVDLEGNKDILALRACAEEDKNGWSCLLQDLRNRGVAEIDLIVTDGHDGILAAVALCLQRPHASGVWSINSAMCSTPFLIASAKRLAPNSSGSSNRRRKRMRYSIWRLLKRNTKSAIPKPYAAWAKTKSIC